MIIGLDLGAVTGWAIGDDESDTRAILESGHKKVGDRKLPAQRFVNFNKLLDEIQKKIGDKLNCVYYEYVYMPHKSTEAAYAYGGYKACLEVWADSRRVKLQGVLCSSARKHVLGSGGLNKEAAFEKIKILYPHVLDHNEADAVLVAHYGMQCNADYLEKIAKEKKNKRIEDDDDEIYN